MRIGLIYPPSADPTAPYISVPLLTAVLRQDGHQVFPIDANAEGYRWLLGTERLRGLSEKLERRLADLDQMACLDHSQMREYAILWRARGDAHAVPRGIDRALNVLDGAAGRDFYDATAYEAAVATVQGALHLVGAVHHPLDLDFAWYRTPFSLLDASAIAADSAAGRDPFREFYDGVLGPRLARADLDWVGISVAFMSQVQPAFALALALRRARKDLPLVIGGAAISQILLQLDASARARALGPFDLAVAGEGIRAVRQICTSVAGKHGLASLGPVLEGELDDLQAAPAPDLDGLDLGAYLSPELVLPYDSSRGCYWGRCAFCHYGPVREGTGCYRERPVARVVEDLAQLSRRHDVKLFYLSQDSIAPRTLLAISMGLRERGQGLRWASDVRPERFFTRARCDELVEGGALALSLGVESGSAQVLARIDKGLVVADVERVVQNLGQAGVAVELMTFTGFPGETLDQAQQTLHLLSRLRQHAALFICGEFSLGPGSRVACYPEEYGLRETWRIAGDQLGTGLFYTPSSFLSEHEQQVLEQDLEKLSIGWTLRRYPWAGALSTAHSLLWYRERGPEAFRGHAPSSPRSSWHKAVARHDVLRVEAVSQANEQDIWARLIFQERQVSRERYEALALDLEPQATAGGSFRFSAGGLVRRAHSHSGSGRGRRRRRR
ncbi:MAG: radical SAM protein [Pseudomonadota bacterium]